MPVVVEHGGIDPTLQALYSLLTAQPQQQAPPPPQSPVHDILSQLAGLNGNGNGNGNGAPNGSDPNVPSYRIREPHEIPQYPSYHQPHGGADQSLHALKSLLPSDAADERYQQQDALAQYHAQQSDQRLGERQRQQNQVQAASENVQLAKWANDLPADLQQELAQGHMAHSPVQTRQMDEIKNSLAKLDAEPTWSPEQKATLKAKLWSQYRDIHSAPQPVPQSQWPQTPQQQAEQSSWKETDPITGLTVTKHASVSRNGEQPPPKIDDVSASHLRDWEDQQKHNRLMQRIALQNQAKIDAAAGKETPEQKQVRMDRESHIKGLQSHLQSVSKDANKAHREYEDAQAELDSLPEDTDKATVATIKAKAAGKLAALNAAKSHLALAQSEVDRQRAQGASSGDYGGEIGPAASVPATETDQAAPPQPSTPADQSTPPADQYPQTMDDIATATEAAAQSSGPPDWYAALPSGATYTAPDGSKRIKP